MNQSRTERLQTERKRKRRAAHRITISAGTLLMAAFIIAASLFIEKYYTLHTPWQYTSPAEGTAISKDPTIQLTFVGDVMMSGHVETLLKQKGYDYPYAYAKSLFQQDDATIANLETPVTKRGAPASNKEFVYKSLPEAIPSMKASGIDLVNLANNHSIDQGTEGLLDTFQALDQNGIQYVGAGANSARAYQPIIIEKKGVKVAFLGFSRVLPEVSWTAGKNKPGVAITYDPARAMEAIRKAKKQADLVVVIAHWGVERKDLPVAHQKELSHAYIDAGADLVIGGHPHVLQGFESYKNKWIAYSLGNFIFTRANYSKTWETMVLQASCSKLGACEVTMQPYRTELGQAVPMNASDGAKLIQRIQSISTNVLIQPNGRVSKATP